MQNLLLFGAGRRGEGIVNVISTICRGKYNIVIVDSDRNKYGKMIEGIVIKSPDCLNNYINYKYCITVASTKIKNDIRNTLIDKIGFNPNQEISYIELKQKIFLNKYILKDNYIFNSEPSYIFDCTAGLVLGGIEAWTTEVCNKLSQIVPSISVKIVSPIGKYNIEKTTEPLVDFLNYEKTQCYDFKAVSETVNYLSRKLPCVVVSGIPNELTLFSAVYLKKQYESEIKIIYMVHGFTDNYIEPCISFEKYIDKIICVSEDLKQLLIERGIPITKISSITLPFKCEKELVRSYSLNIEDPIRLCLASRLVVEDKRVDLILKLIEFLEINHVNYLFEIAGEGMFSDEIYDFIEEYGLGGKVKLVGRIPRENINEFFKRNDVFISLSEYEGRGVSKMEAMGCGCVPIVTLVGGTLEDVTDGVNGYVVNVGDYIEAAQKIIYLYNHRIMLKVLGEAAHATMQPKSDINNHIKFMYNLFSELSRN